MVERRQAETGSPIENKIVIRPVSVAFWKSTSFLHPVSYRDQLDRLLSVSVGE